MLLTVRSALVEHVSVILCVSAILTLVLSLSVDAQMGLHGVAEQRWGSPFNQHLKSTPVIFILSQQRLIRELFSFSAWLHFFSFLFLIIC